MVTESRARVVRDVLTTVAHRDDRDRLARRPTRWPMRSRAPAAGVEPADGCDRAARSRRRRPDARRCRRRGAAVVAPAALRPKTFTTYFAYEGARRRDPSTVGLRVPVRRPGGGDRSSSGERRPVAASTASGRGDVAVEGVGAADRPADAGQFQRGRDASSSTGRAAASAERQLSVEEIIARPPPATPRGSTRS